MSKIFTANDVLLAHEGYGVINPLALDDVAYANLVKVITKLKEDPIGVKQVQRLFARSVGTRFVLPMQALLMSWQNEEFDQYLIDPKRVLGLLMSPANGLLTVSHTNAATNKPVRYVLTKYIEATFKEANIDAEGLIIDVFGVIIGGGRHRLCAIILIVVLSEMILRGLDPITFLEQKDAGGVQEFYETVREIMEDDDFLEMEIPCTAALYSLDYVLNSNLSRSMNMSEKALIGLQQDGIGTNIVDICKMVVDSTTKTAAAAKGWGSMFSLLNDDDNAGMTQLASFQLGQKLYAYLKRDKVTLPVQFANMEILVRALWSVVKVQVPQLTCSNIAREGVPAMVVSVGAYVKKHKAAIWTSSETAVPETVADKAPRSRPTGTKTKEPKAPKAEKVAASPDTIALVEASSAAVGDLSELESEPELVASK